MTESTPLTSQIPAGTVNIQIQPIFGGLLSVSFVRQMGPAIQMEGTVTAITVHGDGRIEYHIPEEQR